MAILHGSWIPNNKGGHLFIWGETWRTMTKVESPSSIGATTHPFAMTQEELSSFLRSHNLASRQLLETSESSSQGSRNGKPDTQQPQWKTQVLVLPTQAKAAHPLLSVRSRSDDQRIHQ